MAARLKGTRGFMCLGTALCLGDESSSKPDTGSSRHRVAVLSPLKTKHTQLHTHTHTQLHTQLHTHRPADDHGSDDWLPSGVEQGAAGWVLGGDDDPQRSQTHEEGANQWRHIWVGTWGKRKQCIHFFSLGGGFEGNPSTVRNCSLPMNIYLTISYSTKISLRNTCFFTTLHLVQCINVNF